MLIVRFGFLWTSNSHESIREEPVVIAPTAREGETVKHLFGAT